MSRKQQRDGEKTTNMVENIQESVVSWNPGEEGVSTVRQ